METQEHPSLRRANLDGSKVLFIAYFFPPTSSTGVPGSLRTVKFLRNLENGEFHVLTVPDNLGSQQNALNHLSLPVNHENIHRVVPWDIFKTLLAARKRLKRSLNRLGKVTASAETPTESQASSYTFKNDKSDQITPGRFQRLKDFVYNLCYFPDQAGPWILPAVRYGRKLVRKEGIDVIFATGSPWSGLVIGYLISKASGKPLIADFRDPWINNPFHHSKGKWLDSIAKTLERKVVHHASIISLNTEPLRDDFITRFPEQDPEKFLTLPNGFDPSDSTDLSTTKDTDDKILTLCHTGFLYGVRDPSTLLEVIREANAELSTDNLKIRLIQVGAVNLSYKIEERFKELIDSETYISKGKLSQRDCLIEQSKADILVNIQPFTKTQIPSKLYEYLQLNKAIVNITPKDGALGKIIIKDQLGIVFENGEESEMKNFLLCAARNRESLNDVRPVNTRKYRIDKITDTLSEKIVNLKRRQHYG
ncbi:glycosyltransferase [uncultured Marinobacter sp.]|uniref:glycosyltransferase n=1 Tax=uncultured Marinobacter sp. TaxID=187379 RepID=UPI0030DC6948|tara:strand:+ start:170 stop:1606 length:1437 start_codon:yes stop_codon:yes gene_type:complete